MTQEQQDQFFNLIDQLTEQHTAKFGKMTVQQVLPHCTDQFRMALGEKLAEEYGQVDPQEVIAKAQRGEPVESPKGFGQIEGEGTPPGNFEADRQQLKDAIAHFRSLSDDYPFHPHPYFGALDKVGWSKLMIYHLNHHLEQFGV